MSRLLETCKMLGLHPIVGFGMAAIDVMLFGAEAATLGIGWSISIPVAGMLAIASILVQKYGFKEGWGLAIGKGLVVGLLTAVPTPLPALVPLVGGAMGTAVLLSADRALPESPRS